MTQCPNPKCKFNNISPKEMKVLAADGTSHNEIWHQLCKKYKAQLSLTNDPRCSLLVVYVSDELEGVGQ